VFIVKTKSVIDNIWHSRVCHRKCTAPFWNLMKLPFMPLGMIRAVYRYLLRKVYRRANLWKENVNFETKKRDLTTWWHKYCVKTVSIMSEFLGLVEQHNFIHARTTLLCPQSRFLLPQTFTCALHALFGRNPESIASYFQPFGFVSTFIF
jgi:hypothetical protein